MENIRDIDFSPEWQFRTSRSSGKGGQNVNKVESRVELEFDVDASQLLSAQQKERIREKLANKINSEGLLQVSSEAERSQLQNKERAIEKFYTLLEQALKVARKRKPTKPGKAAKEKRLREKKLHAEKKENRRIDY